MNTFVQFSRRIRCQVYRANVGGQPTVRVYDGEVEESLDLLDDVDVLDIVSDMVLHALTGRVSGIENAEGHLGEIYKAGRGALQIGNGRGRCRPVYVVATYTATRYYNRRAVLREVAALLVANRQAEILESSVLA